MIHKLTLLLLVSSICVACSSLLKEEQTQEILDFRSRETISSYYNRGKYIVSSVGACGQCHNNISPKIASKSVDNIVDYFRSNDSHAGLKWASDFDLRSIASFLLIESPKQARDLDEEDSGSFFTNKIRGYVNHPRQTATATYGRYLTLNLSNCASCHSSDPNYLDNSLNGGQARNLRELDWKSDEFLAFFNSGSSRGRLVSKKDCSWDFINKAEISDKQAMAYFLESLK